MSLASASRPAARREPYNPPPAASSPGPRRPSPRHDMRCSIGDAATYSVMVGIGETYFAAFALALGTGETFAGLIATLPMLAGASLQLATPWALARFRSYRTWVVISASLQATALLAMPAAAWLYGTPKAAAILVFVAASVYWAASLATSPAWNTWIEEIIPKRLRANYFACRARISQIFTLIGFVIGGLALHWGRATDGAAALVHHWELTAFVGIFLLGAACRYLSATFLSQQTEPSVGRYQSRPVSPRQLLSQASGDVGGRLVLYLLAMQTAVQISGPYFTPFMLAKDKQNLSYLTYMLLIGVCFLGKAIALPLWGRMAHYAGARRLLWIGGTSIVPIAGLWVFIDVMNFWQTTLRLNLGFTQLDVPITSQFLYIGAVQLVSGIVWAAYELAMMLMFFEAIPRHDRAGVLTLYNFGNAVALVLGSLIGAAILQLFNEAYGAYLVLFGLSSVARLATVPLLMRTPSRVVDVTQPPALRVIAVRPDDGSVDRPILPSLAETRAGK